MTQRSVLVVLFEGVQSLDVTGPVEVFAGAGQADGEPYAIRTTSLDGMPVRTSSGLRLTPDCALPDAETPHTLLVPGGKGTHCTDPRLVDWLREHARRAERIVSVCSGALLLAEGGLLDGRRATTHWALCTQMAEEYPKVDVEPDPLFVRDGRIATSAGVTAGIDLALALVEEDHGRDIALSIARYLVVFLRRPGNQAQFSAQLAVQTARREPLRELQNETLLGWLRTASATSAWTTSVCTGSLLLGAAGPLKGRHATSHWPAWDSLAAYGAVPSGERVVIDGKLVTAAGVSAGIDMGLTLLGKVAGDECAQVVQLRTEYDPQPPYDAGSPQKAPAAVVSMLRDKSRYVQQ
ncbi:hypothetical protein FNJ62_04340 [Streptomyces benahoarensis]|uniref:DJ-1/PfpI domain-containing protein n=1 Tax=Streptomyces benahoarensis TaxID=2595054 RepID=A0A553ZQM9_9ACTN|nr:DJ-1/PfpI family protein [Streptomyces benahoarensis]TSB31818.1 hypothetical protein FNJ62_04340 [Streptomyces benahoarensis]TSB43762.1 hypothetical protein FNZ23_02780 [Streptomyces benahoarensis]